MRIVITTAVILSVPLVAMQFTDEVAWGFVDFVAAGALLVGTGLACDFIARKVRTATHRTILIAALVAALLCIWVELAVGLFGTPFAGS